MHDKHCVTRVDSELTRMGSRTFDAGRTRLTDLPKQLFWLAGKAIVSLYCKCYTSTIDMCICNYACITHSRFTTKFLLHSKNL